MQFMVQGVWGIVPVHLKSCRQVKVRGTFPGFAYQLGNLFAANTAVVEARLAEHFRDAAGHPNYAKSLALFTLVTALSLIIVAAIGPKSAGKSLVMCRVRRDAVGVSGGGDCGSHFLGTVIDAGAVALLDNRFRNSVCE